MSSEQSETQTGKKRKLEQSSEEIANDKTMEPKPKRQKLSPSTNEDQKKEEALKQNENKTSHASTDKDIENEKKTETNQQEEVASNIKELIMKKWEEVHEITDIRYLEKERIEVYRLKNDSFENAACILSVEYKEDEEDDTLSEHVVIITKENEILNIELEDKIMLNKMPISECVEYTFSADGAWFVGEITSESLIFYRKKKFKSWQKIIKDPECEAAFKRLLRIGLITTMFDRFVFESPENEKNDYIVKDEHGKKVDIPRPVHKLRKWNVESRKYEIVECRLDGAPDVAQEEKYWKQMIHEFKNKLGCEYVDDLLKSFETKEVNETC